MPSGSTSTATFLRPLVAGAESGNGVYKDRFLSSPDFPILETVANRPCYSMRMVRYLLVVKMFEGIFFETLDSPVLKLWYVALAN